MFLVADPYYRHATTFLFIKIRLIYENLLFLLLRLLDYVYITHYNKA